jgi:hypothetical protein
LIGNAGETNTSLLKVARVQCISPQCSSPLCSTLPALQLKVKFAHESNYADPRQAVLVLVVVFVLVKNTSTKNRAKTNAIALRFLALRSGFGVLPLPLLVRIRISLDAQTQSQSRHACAMPLAQVLLQPRRARQHILNHPSITTSHQPPLPTKAKDTADC